MSFRYCFQIDAVLQLALLSHSTYVLRDYECTVLEVEKEQVSGLFDSTECFFQVDPHILALHQLRLLGPPSGMLWD